jgi:hypothetical protein
MMASKAPGCFEPATGCGVVVVAVIGVGSS